MQIAALIIVCFLGAWLLLYLDHRASFFDLFTDPIGLLFAMFVAFAILFLIYGILKLAFEPSS
jgi:hypothetical protein